MDNNKGCLIYVIIGLIALSLISFKFFNKYIFGNKQLLDLHQSFNTAYIDIPGKSGNLKIKISAWNDYESSDSIQIISTDGTVYYTHLNRVVLCRE